ncbi:MAG: hypothetical protein ACREDH_15575 [Methylocella sp.]
MATIPEIIKSLETMMSDPAPTALPQVVTLAEAAAARVKADAKAALAMAVKAFGVRAVYVGIGVVGTLLVRLFL